MRYAARRVLLEVTKFTTESVKALYEKHGAALVTYACCCGLDFASAEDVVQKVFLKLLEARELAVESPVAYLYRAVRNTAHNYRRVRLREAELADEQAWFTHATADRAEILSLQDALRELPEEQRETVFLRVWSGMTLREIAEATETLLNTVASRYRYALEKLRERLSKHTEETMASHEER